MRHVHSNRALATAVVVLAVLALVFWVPNDTVSGLLQFKRGRFSIGDGMAPAIAFGLMLLSGLLIALDASRSQGMKGLERRSFVFLGRVLGICIAALLLMTFTGPLAVDFFGEADDSYRNLRDTAPWKYLGFALGGTFLIAALIAFVEHRLTVKAVLIGLATVSVLIGVFDLAFDNLLLPPNGDQ